MVVNATNAQHKHESVGSDLAEVERFTGLIREHEAGLRAFVRVLGVEPDWVDDVAQEIFLIAYRERSKFEAGRDFGRWLRGIARRVAANERRKEARHARLLGVAVAEILAQAEDAAETLVATDADHMTAALGECLSHLSERGRTMLCRRYEQGETAPLLAAAFNLSPDAVRQMLVRLRAAVKRCVQAKLTEGAP